MFGIFGTAVETKGGIPRQFGSQILWEYEMNIHDE